MLQSEKIFFDSDNLKIEALLEFNNNNFTSFQDHSQISILCHPHPMHGGTMDNKVVFSLVKACHSDKSATLRFNFRSVGQSEGVFGSVIGEMNDLQNAIKFITTNFNAKKIRLAGFSFGSYIALQTYCKLSAQKKEIDWLKPLIIAPPVGLTNYDFNSLEPKEAIVIQGIEDQIVQENEVRKWVFSRKNNLDYLSLSNCDHFFHRKTIQLRNCLIALMQ